MNKCLDCGTKISRQAQRCKSCARKGKTHSEETKRKMSEVRQGRFGGENHPFFGRKHSKETKRKQSEVKRGEKNPNWGKSPSEETRRKLSEAHQGKKLSPEHCKRISEGQRGKKKHSPESRQKISETRQGRFGGENHPRWKGGVKGDGGGRILIWVGDDHPFAVMRNSRSYVLRSRLVMAEHLGRPLTDDEVVHHEGDVDDDREKMLRLFPDNGEHTKYHAMLRREQVG